MDEQFLRDRISQLRMKKGVSEYQMSLDLGRNKTYIQSKTSGRNLPKMQQFLKSATTLRLHRKNSLIRICIIFRFTTKQQIC